MDKVFQFLIIASLVALAVAVWAQDGVVNTLR